MAFFVLLFITDQLPREYCYNKGTTVFRGLEAFKTEMRVSFSREEFPL